LTNEQHAELKEMKDKISPKINWEEFILVSMKKLYKRKVEKKNK